MFPYTVFWDHWGHPFDSVFPFTHRRGGLRLIPHPSLKTHIEERTGVRDHSTDQEMDPQPPPCVSRSRGRGEAGGGRWEWTQTERRIDEEP